LYDPSAGVGKADGFDVSVADAAKQVGKKVTVEVERVLDGMAYATLVTRRAAPEEPITAEGEAEKPTRASRAKPVVEAEETPAAEQPQEEQLEEEQSKEDEPKAGEQPKKKTRRGSRGGRGRKKPAAAAAAAGNGAAPVEAKIHVPDPELGEQTADEPAAEAAADGDGEGGDGAEAPKPKKKTRRGTRGGRNRRKKPATAAVATAEPAAEEKPSDWEYVPMSEWGDDVGDES
jgi:ribonuclease E